METYISILRGINVGGKNKIKMADLKEIYEELKFKNIVTYIQSGNIIFKTNQNISDKTLSKKIEDGIKDKFNLDVPVIIRTIHEMNHILKNNPYLKMSGIDIEKLHVTFLGETPRENKLKEIQKYDYSPDKFIIIEKEVYVYSPNGYGISKLSNSFFENKLETKATTRNWRTANKLADLAES